MYFLYMKPILYEQINGDTGEALTKGEVRQRTIRCAQHLTKLGCTQNERIAIVARNHHNLTPLLFAAFSIGAPIAPLDVEIGKGLLFWRFGYIILQTH